MRSALAMVFALALALVIAPSFSSADELGTDPRRAGMCDDFDGLPFVFCVAMCEARECDRMPAGDDRCEALAQGFAAVTNGAASPCSAGGAQGSI